MNKAVALIPEEPAGWADRGLMYLRAHDLENAAAPDMARRASPWRRRAARIEKLLLGWLAEEQGKYGDAVGHFKKAVQAHPRNLHYLYAEADAVKKENGPDADAEYQRLIEDGLKVQPDNLFLLRERLTAAVQRGDKPAAEETTTRLKRFYPEWNEDGRTMFDKLGAAMEQQWPLAGKTRSLSRRRFSNVLGLAQPGYAQDVDAVSPPAAMTGVPVSQFLRLAHIPVETAAPDLGVTFTPEALGPAEVGTADALWAVWLNRQDCQPIVYVADGKQLRRADGTGAALPFPGGPKATPPSSCGVVPADFNNDFRTDFLLAGAGGLRFWRQEKDGSFVDATDETKLPRDVLDGDYYGAWAADVDLDGDLDFIVAPRAGAPFVLRNNGDGTFTVLKDVFPGVADVRDFVWADFDQDGAADAAFLDAHGKLSVFLNQRRGPIRSKPPCPMRRRRTRWRWPSRTSTTTVGWTSSFWAATASCSGFPTTANTRGRRPSWPAGTSSHAASRGRSAC